MEKKTKYLLVGFGVVAVGAGAFFYLQQQKKKQNTASDFKDTILQDSTSLPLPSAPQSSSSPNTPSSSKGFPLRKGSKGRLVKNLQTALIKKYGQGILPRFGADGDFGSETAGALASKGFPTTVTSEVFTQIVLNSGGNSPSGSSGASSTKGGVAKMLHSAILKDSISSAIRALKRIKSVSGYAIVNTEFKKTRVGLVRKTLVTALLDRFSSSSEKKAINEQFYRIGLKYDGSKWSLSGLGIVMDQLVTIEPTKIWDKTGQSLQVPKATILGEYLDANNGVTEFETLDRRKLYVKTTSISYVS